MSWRLIFLPIGVWAVILFFILRLKPADVYIPVDVSHYDILKNIPAPVKEEIEGKLLTAVDSERLEEEILSEVPYEEVFEYLAKREKEPLIK